MICEVWVARFRDVICEVRDFEVWVARRCRAKLWRYGACARFRDVSCEVWVARFRDVMRGVDCELRDFEVWVARFREGLRNVIPEGSGCEE